MAALLTIYSYYIFTATLVVMCSDLTGHQTPGPKARAAAQGLILMNYWAHADCQAGRFFSILSSLEAAVDDQNSHDKQGVDAPQSSRRSSVCGSPTSEIFRSNSASEGQMKHDSSLKCISPHSAFEHTLNIPTRGTKQTSHPTGLQESQLVSETEHTAVLLSEIPEISHPSAFSQMESTRDLISSSRTSEYPEAPAAYDNGFGIDTRLSQHGPQLPEYTSRGIYDAALWDAFPTLGETDSAWPLYYA